MPQADHAFRLAVWLTHSRTDAEDVVQDAALRAFQAIADCSGSNPRAWFLSIVRRTAFTWLAKNRPKDLVSTDGLEEVERLHPDAELAFGAQVPHNPEAALLASQRGDRVTRAVDGLPIHYREVVVMREMEEFSYREIADILEVPIGTVMSRLARARAVLVQALAEDRR